MYQGFAGFFFVFDHILTTYFTYLFDVIIPVVSANNTDLTKRASEYQLRSATEKFIRKAGFSESMIRLQTKGRQREQDIVQFFAHEMCVVRLVIA